MNTKIQDTVYKCSGRIKHMILMVLVDILLLIAVLLVHRLLVTSCLIENLSDCPEEICVYFSDVAAYLDGNAINPKDVDVAAEWTLTSNNHEWRLLAEDPTTAFRSASASITETGRNRAGYKQSMRLKHQNLIVKKFNHQIN